MAPKVLPIVRIRDKEYFVDLRLGQFREVHDPHSFIDFFTPEGDAVLEYVPLVECQHCGFRAIISSAYKDEELYCMKCRSKVWMY
jgi:DNA-directed RNA polymerase subunit RPC12/RpoP